MAVVHIPVDPVERTPAVAVHQIPAVAASAAVAVLPEDVLRKPGMILSRPEDYFRILDKSCFFLLYPLLLCSEKITKVFYHKVNVQVYH